MTSTHHAAAVEALKSAPPVTVVGLTLGGVGLQEWVLILTAVYTVLQIGFLLRDKLTKKGSPDDGKH